MFSLPRHAEIVTQTSFIVYVVFKIVPGCARWDVNRDDPQALKRSGRPYEGILAAALGIPQHKNLGQHSGRPLLEPAIRVGLQGVIGYAIQRSSQRHLRALNPVVEFMTI